MESDRNKPRVGELIKRPSGVPWADPSQLFLVVSVSREPTKIERFPYWLCDLMLCTMPTTIWHSEPINFESFEGRMIHYWERLEPAE